VFRFLIYNKKQLLTKFGHINLKAKFFEKKVRAYAEAKP